MNEAHLLQPSSDRRSVIASFRYGHDLRSVVAPTTQECWGKATLLWGPPDALELYSTPWSIYCDITGRTRERHARIGLHQTSDQETW